ncbi:MAG TPA: BadF/BadG/BcrA/BcrD ATPase family protein [Candidatus Baltobacteraceae bacterium]
MTLFGGIDGGQSSTTAVVGDADGRVLGRGSAGPADEVGCDARSTRLKDALEGALAAALDDAGLPRDTRFEAIVAGVSGYAGASVGIAPGFNAARVRLMHDAPIAHVGALGGGPGVIVIAGTGSVVYGVGADGRAVTVGGLGYVFGDEGSAFGIARRAIREADENGALRRRAAAFFGEASALDVARAVYAGRISRDRVAAFAAELLAVPDADVERLVDAEVAALARQIARAKAMVAASGPVAATGGMTRDAYYMKRLGRLVDLVAPLDEPAIGALSMARSTA